MPSSPITPRYASDDSGSGGPGGPGSSDPERRLSPEWPKTAAPGALLRTWVEHLGKEETPFKAALRDEIRRRGLPFPTSAADMPTEPVQRVTGGPGGDLLTPSLGVTSFPGAVSSPGTAPGPGGSGATHPTPRRRATGSPHLDPQAARVVLDAVAAQDSMYRLVQARNALDAARDALARLTSEDTAGAGDPLWQDRYLQSVLVTLTQTSSTLEHLRREKARMVQSVRRVAEQSGPYRPGSGPGSGAGGGF